MPAVTDPSTAAGAPGEVESGLEGSGGERSTPTFAVHLDVFDGPFDLLLSLIARKRLDVTLVALAQVTDDFIAYIRSFGEDWDLDQASAFLVVAATLLDLKVSRLLPAAEVVDDEDLALLEARDLLFARLLQYRAYKQVAEWMRGRLAAEALHVPRSVSLEPALAQLLPEVLLGVSPAQLAEIAARAGRRAAQEPPVVSVDHLHAPAVNVREQAALLAARLRDAGRLTFRALVADAQGLPEVVGRFLAVLELYRDGRVLFEQLEPLGELHVRWVAEHPADPELEPEPEPGQATQEEEGDDDVE